MPHDGAQILSEVRVPFTGVCERRERYEEGAHAEHGGEVKMPDLLGRRVADCPRGSRRSASMIGVGRCMTKSRYGRSGCPSRGTLAAREGEENCQNGHRTVAARRPGLFA